MATIDYGVGPNTPTGDTQSLAFAKLEARVVAAEARVNMPTTLAFTAYPQIAPVAGAVGTTFTALDGTPINGNIDNTRRRWILSGVQIGNGLTIVPVTPGTLVLANTAFGANGEELTVYSQPVIVTAFAAATIDNTPGTSTLPGSAVAGFIARVAAIDARLTALGK